MAATKIATAASVATDATTSAPKKVRVNVKQAAAAAGDVAEKVTNAIKKEKEKAPKPADPTEAPVEPAPSADEVPLGERINDRMTSLVAKIQQLESTVVIDLKDMKQELKTLQKDMAKFQKAAAASSGKRKRKQAKTTPDGADAPRRSSGFQKPTGISDQLADFLQIPRGTMLPRMEVTRKILDYIKEHNLQNPEDRRKIIPDAAFQAVLGTTPETEVSYFNYQGFLKNHFISAPATTTA